MGDSLIVRLLGRLGVRTSLGDDEADERKLAEMERRIAILDARVAVKEHIDREERQHGRMVDSGRASRA